MAVPLAGERSVPAWHPPPEHLRFTLGRSLSRSGPAFSSLYSSIICNHSSLKKTKQLRQEGNECRASYSQCLIQHKFLLKLFSQLNIHNPKRFIKKGQSESLHATLPYAFKIITTWYL